MVAKLGISRISNTEVLAVVERLLAPYGALELQEKCVTESKISSLCIVAGQNWTDSRESNTVYRALQDVIYFQINISSDLVFLHYFLDHLIATLEKTLVQICAVIWSDG